MAHGKLGLGTEGEMVVRMRVKGSTSHFLQWDFLHKCFFVCSRSCYYTTQLWGASGRRICVSATRQWHSYRKTVARLVCSEMILQWIEKVTVYYCGLQVVPYLTCMLCWLHVSRCSQKLKKKEWQLFPDWLPSHRNMYVFLFYPICYICLYDFMMKKTAEQEFVDNCLHFCYSFTGNENMGRGWIFYL